MEATTASTTSEITLESGVAYNPNKDEGYEDFQRIKACCNMPLPLAISLSSFVLKAITSVSVGYVTAFKAFKQVCDLD